MIKTKVFRKYLSIGTLFLLIFIFLGFFFNHFIIETLKPKREMLPPLFFAKLVDKLGGEDKVRGIQELKEIHDKGPLPHLILIDKNGIILTEPSPYTPELSWKDILKPDLPYQYTEVPLIQLKFKNSKEFPSHGPPPSRLFGFGPKGPPPPEERKAYLVRLSSPIEYYLLIVPTPHRPPFDKDETDWIGLISFSTLIISLILGVGVTITFVYNSVKNGVEQADSVIDELRRGNLKARFVIKRSDEFGQAMKRFNVMADEIETLVNNLRDSQQAKSKLLQELAHDLRTPVASLKSFLETLHLKGNLLNESVKEEFLELSLKEVDYFGKLVEDLLFLTQMDTPSYNQKNKPVNLIEVLKEEAQDCLRRYELNDKKVKLNIVVDKIDSNDKSLWIDGDPHILKRLFRNAFENAFSFANSQVAITVNSDQKNIAIQIEDDGPGFPTEVLDTFGKKRVSRKLDSQQKGRISLGLGGVVMNKICESYLGTLNVYNKIDSDEHTKGAGLKITFPQKSIS